MIDESVGCEGKSSDYSVNNSNIYALIKKEKLTKQWKTREIKRMDPYENQDSKGLLFSLYN